MNALKNFWDLRSRKQRIWIVIVLSVIVLSIVGNLTGGTNSDESKVSPVTTPSETADPRTEVQWEDYAPSVKTRIDDMMVAKDCAGLQEQFDVTDSNNAATMNRTGHNNSKLMMYEMEAMEIAGCSK